MTCFPGCGTDQNQKSIMDAAMSLRVVWGIKTNTITVDMGGIEKNNTSSKSKPTTPVGTIMVTIIVQPIVKLVTMF